MPDGHFTEKEDREIEHIEESEEREGYSKRRAENIAYGRVQNQRKNLMTVYVIADARTGNIYPARGKSTPIYYGSEEAAWQAAHYDRKRYKVLRIQISEGNHRN